MPNQGAAAIHQQLKGARAIEHIIRAREDTDLGARHGITPYSLHHASGGYVTATALARST